MKNIKNNLNGFIVIDKPYQMGSTQVVSTLKYFLHPTKIGHAGTLDPLATGVLPIAFGKATRLISYVMEGKKTYRFIIKWGIETDSDDLAGKEIATNNKHPSEQEIRKIIPNFIGKISQTPSRFSAIKVNGKRAYDLARSGQEISIKPRTITIYNLNLLNTNSEEATFEVVCSKGTYVRTLAHDISHTLGTVGVVTMLRRINCAPFDIAQATSLEDIKSSKITSDNLSLLPMENVVKNIPSLIFSKDEINRLSQGQRLSYFKLEHTQQFDQDGLYCASVKNKIHGLVQKSNHIICPKFIWEK